jgi:hypothetical protein
MAREYKTRQWEYDEGGNRGITCVKCKIFKTEENYSRLSGSGLGIKYKCRECCNLEKDLYSKTKRGVLQTIWDSQKLSNKTRKLEKPTYPKEWMFEWCLSQELFHNLFDKWVESGYIKAMKPSIDRISNFKSYTKDNIQLMTWEENRKKANECLRNGTSRFEYVGVTQLSKEGEPIKEFLNSRQAERELGIVYTNIHNCCKGRRPFAGGFRWKFTEKEITDE